MLSMANTRRRAAGILAALVMLASLFGLATTQAAQALTGTSVSFTVLQEGIPETARVRNVVDGVNQWQPYGTTRHDVDKTCPANSYYKLQVPGKGGTRLLQPGECKTWTTVGDRTVGVFRADYTPPVDPPPPGDYPNATNTGFQGDPSTLPRRDSWRITTPGAVIENLRIDASDGGLIIDAPNVTIRDVWVDAGIWGIDALGTSDGMVIEDTTVVGGLQAGIGIDHSDGWRVQRVNLYGGNDGIKPGGSGVVRDSFIHDLGQIGNDPHNDAMQFGNARGILIEHNRMQCRDTSCIAMFEGQATYRDVTINDNIMGGAGYTIYAGGTTGTNIVITNNMIGSYGYQHPVTDWVNKPDNVFSGNVYTDGRPVPTPGG
jgi:hypothetical protein